LASADRLGGALRGEKEKFVTRHNIPLGKILGIPIGLDYSWFLIFAILTRMLGSSYYPPEFKNWPPVLVVGAVSALAEFLIAIAGPLVSLVLAIDYASDRGSPRVANGRLRVPTKSCFPLDS